MIGLLTILALIIGAVWAGMFLHFVQRLLIDEQQKQRNRWGD